MPVLAMTPLHPGLLPAILLNLFDQFLDLHYVPSLSKPHYSSNKRRAFFERPARSFCGRT